MRVAISTMKEGKESDNDGLVIDLFKVVDDVVTMKIAKMFAEILRSHKILKDWTLRMIILLHKNDRGNLKKLPTNHIVFAFISALGDG